MKLGTCIRMMCLLLACCLLATPLGAQGLADLNRGVVKIRAGKSATGTGFVIYLTEKSVYVVTASHVVEGAGKVEVEFFTRRNRPVAAEILDLEAGDPKGLAVLRVDGEIPQGLVRLALDPHTSVDAGDPVVMIGFPRTGSPWSVTRGEVVGRYQETILFSGAVEEGNSGGPLLKGGRVIGVVSQTMGKFSYATPALIARYVLESWGVPDAERESLARMLAAESRIVRRRSMEPDPDDERDHWPDLGVPKRSVELLELSVLLAVESMRRSPSPDGREALRIGLDLFSRPVARFASSSKVAFSPDGRFLATTGPYEVTLRDAATWEVASRLPHDEEVTAVAFGPTGKLLATGTKAGTAHLWELADGRELGSLKHEVPVHSVVFAIDGSTLLTTSVVERGRGRVVHAWDITDGRERWRRPQAKPWVDAIELDPHGVYVAGRTAANRGSGKVWVWDIETGEEVWQRTDISSAEGIGFSTDGQFLVTGRRKLSRLWSVEDWQEMARIPGSSSAIAFSPDGAYLASQSGRWVSLWDLEDLFAQRRVLPGDSEAVLAHRGLVNAMVFSSDSKYLATGSNDGMARLWEVATGEEVVRLQHRALYDPRVQPAKVKQVVPSPDGRHLISWDDRDGIAKLWRLWPQDLVTEACERLNRNLTPDEWRTHIGAEPYRRTCSNLP